MYFWAGFTATMGIAFAILVIVIIVGILGFIADLK